MKRTSEGEVFGSSGPDHCDLSLRVDQKSTSPWPFAIARASFSDPVDRADAPTYFHAIDLLRGLAAVSILFWHYSHFFVSGTSFPDRATSANPLYREFWLLYDHGGNAVQLFWLISGFTFASVYTRRRVSTRTFAVHRFARLYPLHLLTLCVVAGLQALSWARWGYWWIYSDNDLPHFVDQFFLTSAWGPATRFSFNGPVWTVSVELVVYALFWLSLPRLFARGLLAPLAIALISLGLSRLGPYSQFLQGSFFFFVGCALYPVFLACRSMPVVAGVASALPIGAALTVLIGWGAVGIGSTLLMVGLVLCAAFTSGIALPTRARRAMRWVGDNTYGIYLWHVPVQITTLMAFEEFGLDRAVFLTPAFLLTYIGGVVALARLSFVLFERPCRTLINARYEIPAHGSARPGPGHAAAMGQASEVRVREHPTVQVDLAQHPRSI